jgi:hypothetical protein
LCFDTIHFRRPTWIARRVGLHEVQYSVVVILAMVALNVACSGYTMALPGPGLYAQSQSNMAATVNIDWLVELARQACAMAGIESHRHTLLAGVEAHVAAAAPGSRTAS